MRQVRGVGGHGKLRARHAQRLGGRRRGECPYDVSGLGLRRLIDRRCMRIGFQLLRLLHGVIGPDLL